MPHLATDIIYDVFTQAHVPEPYFFVQVEKLVWFSSTQVYIIVQLSRWEVHMDKRVLL